MSASWADIGASLDWRSIGIAAATIVASLIGTAGLFRLTQTERRSDFQIGANFGPGRGTVESWSGRSGYVRIGGELWRARAQRTLSPGDTVKVTHVRGMLVSVTQV
jgi:membrane protein implicated in regulation of membrane protease activity